MFEIVQSIENEKWADFVNKNPRGNIFQSPEMAEVYKKTKNMEPITLFAIKNGRIYASLLAYLTKEKNGVLDALSRRLIIHGGPIFAEGEDGIQAFLFLMEHCDNSIKKKAIFTEIRMMHDISEFSLLRKFGYEYEEHLNYLIRLDRPLEEIWNNVKKSRRYGIKKARKSNVIIEEIKDEKLLHYAYDLLVETYKNAQLPIADISLFESAFETLVDRKMAKFFLAENEKKYIGTIIILINNGVVYDWYAGSSQSSLDMYPNDILTWCAIENSSGSGYTIFDFGGAGKPNEKYGVREFKKQFGGEVVNYGRYRKIHSSKKMKIAKIGFKIYRKVKL